MVLRFAGPLLICAAAIEGAVEAFNHAGCSYSLLTWLARRPDMVLLNLAICLSSISFLAFLANSLAAGCQLGAIAFLLPAAAHWLKERWLGQPLVPSDAGLLGQMLELAPRMCSPGMAVFTSLLLLGTILMLGVTLRAAVWHRFSANARVVACLGSLITPALVMADPPPSMFVSSAA
jgi:hypothetical protein